MYRAAEHGHLEVVELLISRGAKVNCRHDVSVHNYVILVIICTMIVIALQKYVHVYSINAS